MLPGCDAGASTRRRIWSPSAIPTIGTLCSRTWHPTVSAPYNNKVYCKIATLVSQTLRTNFMFIAHHNTPCAARKPIRTLNNLSSIHWRIIGFHKDVSSHVFARPSCPSILFISPEHSRAPALCFMLLSRSSRMSFPLLHYAFIGKQIVHRACMKLRVSG